jgi:hypothetical protein
MGDVLRELQEPREDLLFAPTGEKRDDGRLTRGLDAPHLTFAEALVEYA